MRQLYIYKEKNIHKSIYKLSTEANIVYASAYVNLKKLEEKGFLTMKKNIDHRDIDITLTVKGNLVGECCNTLINMLGGVEKR